MDNGAATLARKPVDLRAYRIGGFLGGEDGTVSIDILGGLAYPPPTKWSKCFEVLSNAPTSAGIYLCIPIKSSSGRQGSIPYPEASSKGLSGQGQRS